MKERVNWIDWAKAMAVCSVVFCHLPQSQEWFYYRYLQAVTITVFFFISGYLKKDRGSDKENWRKYWHGLIVPYIIYNVIVYPYWIFRYYMLNGEMPNIFQALRPVIGALLFEHENTFAEPLNGPLWYLPAILIMHAIIDLCRKNKHLHIIMIVLCIISYFLYAANKYYEFLPNLTPMGIFRRLPYYYIGYVMGRKQMFRENQPKREFVVGLTCLIFSLIFFDWHLHEQRILLHALLFYPVNIGFLIGVICFCKLLDTNKTAIIINLSIGTLVVIGLHNILIGAINFAVEHFITHSGAIGYYWYEALPLTILIVALLYPVIPFAKQHAPVLLGKTKEPNYGTK